MIETSPQNRHLEYARVITYGQTLHAQLQQFRAEGCANFYREKASGAQTNRPQLARVLAQLAKGRRADCDAPRPAGAVNERPSQHAGGDHRQWRGLSLNNTWADMTTAHGA
jgi:Resolvase, N terminal domain